MEAGRAALWSPHNSARACWVPLARARDLAAAIRREIARSNDDRQKATTKEEERDD